MTLAMPGAMEHLRLDLFLKRSRLVKRRPLAALLCDSGHVTVNGREAPPGKAVRPGDHVTVHLLRERITVEILFAPTNEARAKDCYRELEREKIEEEI